MFVFKKIVIFKGFWTIDQTFNDSFQDFIQIF